MEHIDFSKIAAQTGRDYKTRAILSEVDRVGINNVMISDCLVNVDRDGLMVMRTLHNHFMQNRDLFYKIHVIQDLWGNPVKPGQKIEWKAGMKKRDPFGKKYSIQQIKNFQRRGELRQIEIWHNATVDDKGCINVSFEDAAILLSERGVHYLSKEPITTMPEKSKITIDPKTNKPVKPVQFFWLYEEVNLEDYVNLPSLTKKSKE